MLPAPTAEMLLILGAFKQHTGDNTEACSTFLNGVRDQIRAARKERPVVLLRQMVPELDTARDGAESALCALCVVCPRRGRCAAPLV